MGCRETYDFAGEAEPLCVDGACPRADEWVAEGCDRRDIVAECLGLPVEWNDEVCPLAALKAAGLHLATYGTEITSDKLTAIELALPERTA